MTMTDSNLKWTIGEWMPFFFTLEIGLLMLVAMILVAGLQYRREIPGWRLGLVAVFLAAGISSLRHMAFFALTAIPVVIWVLDRLYRQVAINPEQEKRAMKTYMVLGMLAAGILVWETGWTAYRWWRVANGDNFYPVRAVQFLKERNYQGELFAEYGWGGYLLWQYPEKKLFIDGRMPSMRWTAPSDRESDWAFKDYLDITGAGEIEPYFGKYDVGVVLWPKQSPTPIETLTAAIAKKFGQGEERKSFIQKLEEAGWEKVYEDKRAVIYVR